MQYSVSHLALNVIGEFVLAKDFMWSSHAGENEIRKAVVQAVPVDCMVTVRVPDGKRKFVQQIGNKTSTSRGDAFGKILEG